MPSSHPDTDPTDPTQVRDSAAPKIDPNGGVVPHLAEPPEVGELLPWIRPWQVLLLLAIASVWLPAVLAALGTRIARADLDAAEARWAVEDAAILAANPPGDCDAYAILRQSWGDPMTTISDAYSKLSGMRALHVQYSEEKGEWVPVMDVESPENLARHWSDLPGTEMPHYDSEYGYVYNDYSQRFSVRQFPSRVAATYQPGSIYYELFRLQEPFLPLLQEAVDCGSWPRPYYATGPYTLRVDWERLNDALFYVLHRAAFQRDWATFLHTCDLAFAIGPYQPYNFWVPLLPVLGVILEQHGAAMPVPVLRELRVRVVGSRRAPPDVDKELATWKRDNLRQYLASMLEPEVMNYHYFAYPNQPIFMQREAILYLLRRGQVDAIASLLHEEITTNLATPGFQISRFTDEGHMIDDSGKPIPISEIGTYAYYQSRYLEGVVCHYQTRFRLSVAALDALLQRAETGAWPASMAALGEPELRVDPSSPAAAPFGLRVDATGALRIWSTGGRGVNGGGLFSSEPGFFDSDLVQRVELPLADGSGAGEGTP